MNPYDGAKDFQFWKRAVRDVEFFDLDPLPAPRFTISRADRIVTAGSCFAQHLARALKAEGFAYHVTETGDGLSVEDRQGRQYGLFSARYGNIYTAAHLRQLLEEAFGLRQVDVQAAQRATDGRFVDLLRPTVEPGGYDSAAAVAAAREVLLEAVRRMVREGDVFVFTMGLTEAWRCRSTGTVFPLAPGVVAGAYDPQVHEFKNFSAAGVREDLETALAILWRENPDMRVILTVSPVPLIATYEARQVMVATTYSKSVLRVVADELEQQHERVLYFPAYEIITGPFNQGRYFEEDLREVNAQGVAHVMRVVMDRLAEPGAVARDASPQTGAGARADFEDFVCDEEEITRPT